MAQCKKCGQLFAQVQCPDYQYKEPLCGECANKNLSGIPFAIHKERKMKGDIITEGEVAEQLDTGFSKGGP